MSIIFRAINKCGKGVAVTMCASSSLLFGGISHAASLNDEEINTYHSLDAGETATNVIVNGGGILNLEGGASSSGTAINDKGVESVQLDASSHAAAIKNGGTQKVAGTASAATINAGGSQEVSGVSTGTVIQANGVQSVFGPGVAEDTTIYGGGYQYVLGTAQGTDVDGGYQEIQASGVANDTKVHGWGSQVLKGGTANASDVYDYGKQEVRAGGIANDSVIHDTGRLTLLVGGTTNRAHVGAGGTFVNSGGVSNDTVIDGGIQDLSESALDNNTTIISGEQRVASEGVVANGTQIKGGTQSVTAGVTNNVVIDGGLQSVSGGSSNGTRIVKGEQRVVSMGVSNDSVVESGGLQTVNSYGRSHNTLVKKGATQDVGTDGSAFASLVNGGIQYVTGFTQDTKVTGNGRQFVHANGFSLATEVAATGIQRLYSGATADSTVVKSGGMLFVQDDSRATNVTQEAGGLLVAYTSASASGTNALGNFYIDGNAHTTNNVLIEKGGALYAMNDLDRVHNSTIDGGVLMVKSGAHLTGTTRLIDGELESLFSTYVVTDGDLVYDYSGALGQNGMYNSGLTFMGEGSVVKEGAGGLRISKDSSLAGGLQLKGGTLWLEDSRHGAAVGKAALTLSGPAAMHAIVDKAVLESASGLVMADGASDAQLTIKDTALAATSGSLLLEAKNGSQLTTTVERSILTGDIAFRDSSSGWLNLLDNSRLTGTIDPVNVKVDGSSRWDVTGNSSVGALVNDGVVDFRAGSAGFSTLEVNGDLSGNGVFAMRTSLATPQGDLLQVKGQTLGAHTLVVEDSGQEPVSAAQLMLVDGNGGSGSFGLYGDHVDVGAFRYTLQRQGDDWYLATPVTEPVTPPTEPVTPPTEPVTPPTEPVTPPTEPVTPPTEPVAPPTGPVTPPTEPVAPPTEPVTPPTEPVTPPTEPVAPVTPPARPFNPSPDNLSSGANAAVALHGASAGMWNAQMNAVVKRLGELRMGKDEGGIWTRAIGKRFEVDEGA
ncbi:autotransporter outer membrane beta-barrel domain-containing protein, partial [Pseudomonas sp. NPDC090755]|uniref:autotransporter outer membrane beta-barrel domain-containing protein n=1 Tax=Pseudomonas sp. NPDC090755 TaxID=3364481 RepID=UPI00383B337E